MNETNDDVLKSLISPVQSLNGNKKNQKHRMDVDALFPEELEEGRINVTCSLGLKLVKKIDQISNDKKTSRAEVVRRILEAALL
jgi:hypothetical protein